tara:strand:+ start:245 stop:433 length:189 start_codon:yes stop_codon:yes gene_type:complete
MMYNPEKPLTNDELEELGKKDFDKFLEYLDSQSAYLKSKAGPPDKKQTEIVKMMQEKKYLSS